MATDPSRSGGGGAIVPLVAASCDLMLFGTNSISEGNGVVTSDDPAAATPTSETQDFVQNCFFTGILALGGPTLPPMRTSL